MRTDRLWYGFTATYPKDMVIMIDKSHEMRKTFGDNSRMSFGILAAKAVVDSLNPNDNVRTNDTAVLVGSCV